MQFQCSTAHLVRGFTPNIQPKPPLVQLEAAAFGSFKPCSTTQCSRGLWTHLPVQAGMKPKEGSVAMGCWGAAGRVGGERGCGGPRGGAAGLGMELQSAGKGARMDSSSLYSCSYTGREGVELLCSKPFPPSSEGLIAEDCQGLEKGKLG